MLYFCGKVVTGGSGNQTFAWEEEKNIVGDKGLQALQEKMYNMFQFLLLVWDNFLNAFLAFMWLELLV